MRILASSSCTFANLRLSLASNCAFVDFSAATVLTNRIGRVLILRDSTGKPLTGIIQAAGSSQTLDDEIISNPSFDSDTTGWQALGNAVLASVADGQVNNCLQITENGTANPYTSQLVAVTIVPGGAYLVSGYVKSGTNATYRLYGISGSNNIGSNATQTSTGSWVQRLNYGTANVVNTTGNMNVMNMATVSSGKTHLFDEVSMKRLLTPAATGVTIIAAPGSSSQNWLSRDSSFNVNDTAGYTYQILDGLSSGFFRHHKPMTIF